MSSLSKFSALLGVAVVLSHATPAIAQSYLDEYELYSAALENNDRAGAERHANAAWLAAEDELGDHKTTTVLAYNYALATYYTNIEATIPALQRVIELVEAGISDIDPREPKLMLAYAAAVKDPDDSDAQYILLDTLKMQNSAGVQPSDLSASGWLHLAGYNLRNRKYHNAVEFAENAENEFKIIAPSQKRPQGTALIIQTAAYVASQNRSKKDIEKAHDAIYRAIYMYPPQDDIDTFDSEFASALVWHAVVHGLAGSDTRQTGTNLRGLRLEDDNPEPLRRFNRPDLGEVCNLEWAKRIPPNYPRASGFRGNVGGALIGYNINENLKAVDVRIIAEVPFASPFGQAALESVKTFELASDPGPPECKRDYTTIFSFQF